MKTRSWLFLLVLVPTSPVWCDDAANCLNGQRERDAGHLDEAIALYDRCIAEGDLTDRNRSVALNNIGNIYLDKQQYAAAIERFNQAIELVPAYSKPYNNRGVALQNLGRYREAVADYSKAIELNPAHVNAYNNLAWIRATCPLDELRNGAEAVQLALRVNRLSEWKDAEHLDTLAAAYAETGNFAEAVKYEKSAIELRSAGAATPQQERLSLFLEGKPYREPRKGGAGI